MKKTNQRLFPLLLLLVASMALLAFGVFTNVLTDLLGADIRAFFRENPWLVALFALLLGLVGYLYTKIESRSEKPAEEEVDKDQYDEAFVQFRKNLLEQYQTRLASKTGRRLPVNLTAKSTHFGMAPERVEAYFKDKELTIESENIASETDKILKKFDRLLLIGDPGAGKTTILLYAAINILNTSYSSNDSESSDELQKLPLILNLATWSEGRDFAEWYAQNIAHSYSLSPVFVQELLRRNAVVSFFDGFDEVAEKSRDDCFRQMAAYFGDQSSRQLIVSSRKKEYAAAKADAPVYAEIEVLPLSLAQIKKALLENAQSQAADRALLHALEHDQWLAEAVETPFYLNTASFLFGKSQRTLADFPFEAENTEGRQAELVEIFVAEQVPEERDRKYLSFLAGKMEEENFLVFELVKMQPGWGKNLWRYRFASGLLFGFAGWVMGYLAGIGWIFSLPIGLFFGLAAAVGDKISPSEFETWNWKTLKKHWKKGLLYGSFVGFFSVLFVILPLGLSNSDKYSLQYIFQLSLISGLLLGLYVGLNWGGTDRSQFLCILSPYQRFKRSFDDKLLHFSLRLVLYLEGKMPLRVVTFLDRMTDQLIFEDTRRTDKKGRKMRGATWRFRHKILQDYFAKGEVLTQSAAEALHREHRGKSL